MARLIPDYDFKVNDTSLKSAEVIKRISVDLPVNSQASSFSATLVNEGGAYNNYFSYHDDVKVYLGYQSEGTLGVFHGRIEKVKKRFSKSGATIEISGRGTWVKLMEKFTVNSYTNTDLGTIIITEVGALVTGITTNNVASAGIAPSEEFLDHVFLSDMVSDYCNKAQYFAWVDFDDDLHFTGSPGANSVSITSGTGGNVEDISLGIDWKTVRNYIRVYGKQVEGVQLLKTEQDDSSVAKYGTVMKIIKNAGMDSESLVQSIADAALLEDKEAEWGGMATVYGDERIEPGKTITVNVPEIGVNDNYRVRHVKHVFEPRGVGFKTTVMLVQDEEDTARFYKELYEKTKDSTEFANEGNYEESHVFKFTKDQDNLWTFSNCFTTDSSLRIGSPTSGAGTATLTNPIVGDKNYTKCLPFVSEEFPGNDANKYYASNDGGSTWEELDPHGGEDDTAIEHTFASASGDKNDLKFKITVDTFDVILHGTKTDEVIAYRPTNLIDFDYGTGITFKEYWRYNDPWGGMVYGIAFDQDKKIYLATGDDKVYTVDAVSGMNSKEEAALTVDIGGMYHDGTNLHLMDRTNNRISTRNASDLTVEDSNTPLPAGAGTEGYGLGHDGTDFIFTSRADGSSYCSNAVWVKCSSTQRLPKDGYYGNISTYAQTGAGYCSVNSRFYAVRDGTKYLMEFNSDMISVNRAINMETVCGVAGYQPQSCCDDNSTLWSTNYNGSTNRICKHDSADYANAAVATYDFSESSYGKFVGICFDGTDLWVLSNKGTYGTWYRINTSGVIQATHTITSTNSAGNAWADCEWDGSNLHATYTTKGTTNRDKIIYKFDSTPTTISTELHIGFLPKKKCNYDGTIGRGLAWDGSNFWITWYYAASGSRGQWFPLANATEWGAITEAWYPFDCCSDGTYIWFIENTSSTTQISRSTGEEVEELTTFEFAYAMDYAPDITSSKVYTFGAYLKLE